jgi:hypothetical protein
MKRFHVIAVVVVALAGCGGDDTSAPTSASTPAVTPTAPAQTPEPTAAPASQALWPAQGTGATPVEVARSFVVEAIGIEDPALGAFQEGEPRAGEVPVHRRGEDGRKMDLVVATVSLRQLDGEHWYVTSVQSPEVEIETPEPLADVGSPLRVSGRGRGFEGNVVLEVRRAFATAKDEPLAQKPVTAGSMADLAPFEAELPFAAPAGETGAIVARTGSGIAAADGFAAFPVRFR